MLWYQNSAMGRSIISSLICMPSICEENQIGRRLECTFDAFLLSVRLGAVSH